MLLLKYGVSFQHYRKQAHSLIKTLTTTHTDSRQYFQYCSFSIFQLLHHFCILYFYHTQSSLYAAEWHNVQDAETKESVEKTPCYYIAVHLT